MQRRIFRTRIESEVLSVVSLVCLACLCLAEINKNLLSINLNPLEADSISLTLPHLPLSLRFEERFAFAVLCLRKRFMRF